MHTTAFTTPLPLSSPSSGVSPPRKWKHRLPQSTQSTVKNSSQPPLLPQLTSPQKRTPKHRIRTLYLNARKTHTSGDVPKTRTLLHKALTLDPRDSHTWLFLARLESNLRTPNASKVFAEAIKHCPDNVYLLHAWAVHEHRHGERQYARELFQTAYKLDPGNVYVAQAWGLLEQRCGNEDRARELFRQGARNVEVCAAWGSLEARAGEMETARQLFREGLDTSNGGKGTARIYCAWAEAEARVGDLATARGLLNKGIAEAPEESEVYVALGRLEARRGGTQRALELMRAAAALSKKPDACVFNHWALIEWQHCGRVEEARNVLLQGQKLYPRDPALLQTMGTLEDKLGNGDEAKKWFEKSVAVRPTAPALVAWALLEERSGDTSKAKKLFERALVADKLHGAAYNAYGMMYARMGELDQAKQVYERGLSANASTSVWHGYGMLELKIGQSPQRARELFRKGTARTSEDTVFIWHSWGMLELADKQILEARNVFKSALKRYPRNSRLLVGAAMAYAGSCPTVRADEIRCREYFRRAIGADPTHAHAWQAWGVFELRQGRLDAALALFKRGLRLCPGHGALWQAWGVLETSRGNFDRARQLFERGAQACPAHVHLFQAWACMEVQAGNIDKARQLLDKALESDSSHGPVWNAYGLLEARHGSLAQARQSFVTGIRRAPHHSPLYRTFGQMEMRAGNYDKARQLFKDGLRIDPRHAPLYHALAQFEGMMGNVVALAELKKQAEMFFATEDEAMKAINGEDEAAVVAPEDDDSGCRYEARSTPMEIALGNPESEMRLETVG